MNTDYLYDKLESFYIIRDDNYARDYLNDFIRVIVDEGVCICDLQDWYDENKSKIHAHYNHPVSRDYDDVLNHYIQYISLSSILDDVRSKKRTVKIHESFNDFKNSIIK